MGEDWVDFVKAKVQGDCLPNPDDTGRLIICRKRVRPRKTRHSVFGQIRGVPCWQSSALWRQYGCWNLWNGQCCWWLEGQMKCRPAILCLKIHFWSRQRGGNFWEHDKRHSSVSLAFSAVVVVASPHSHCQSAIFLWSLTFLELQQNDADCQKADCCLI